jgi:hypothetical protein
MHRVLNPIQCFNLDLLSIHRYQFTAAKPEAKGGLFPTAGDELSAKHSLTIAGLLRDHGLDIGKSNLFQDERHHIHPLLAFVCWFFAGFAGLKMVEAHEFLR